MCRTYSSYDINWKDSWEQAVNNILNDSFVEESPIPSSHLKDGRGNIAPATIILPTLAMEAKKKAEKEQKVPPHPHPGLSEPFGAVRAHA